MTLILLNFSVVLCYFILNFEGKVLAGRTIIKIWHFFIFLLFLPLFISIDFFLICSLFLTPADPQMITLIFLLRLAN